MTHNDPPRLSRLKAPWEVRRDSPTVRANSASITLMLPLLLLIATIFAILASSSATEINEKILWGSIGLSAYLASLFTFLFSKLRYFGLFEVQLGAWFLAYAILAFGVSTLTIMQPQIGTAAMVDKTKVPTALLLIGLSFTLWSFGYVVGRARIFQTPFRWGNATLMSGLSNEFRRPSTLLLTFACGIAADFLMVFVGGQYGYLGNSLVATVDSVAWYTQPLVIVSSLKFAAVFGLAARVFIGRTDSFVRYVLPTLAFTVAIGLLTGMKESFLIAFVSVGVPYLLGSSRWRLLPMIGVVLVFVFFVTPTISGLRQDVRGGSGSLDVVSALNLGVNKIFSGNYLVENNSPQNSVSTMERIRLIDNLALIITKSPDQIPYRSLGEVVSAPVTGFVPRLVWPDKPVRLSGYEFYRIYYEGTSYSSSAITLQGSLYLYGGLWVLLVGMLIVGLATRALDEALDVKNNLHGALFLVLVLSVIVKQEMDAASFLSAVPSFIISWVLGAHLIFERSHPKQPANERRGAPSRRAQ